MSVHVHLCKHVCMSLDERVCVYVCGQAHECGNVCVRARRHTSVGDDKVVTQMLTWPESRGGWNKISYGNSVTTQQNQYSNRIAFIDNVSCKKGFN